MGATTMETHENRRMRRLMDAARDAGSMQSVSACALLMNCSSAAALGVLPRVQETPLPVCLLGSSSVFNAASELTFESARFRPLRSPATTTTQTRKAISMGIMSAPPLDFPATTLVAMDACASESINILPSLKEALEIQRTLGEGKTPPSHATRHSAPLPMPTTTLTASDWEDILESCGGTEEYVSPNVSLVFENQYTLHGSQELDTGGHEFINSPAIPVIGRVPRTFGDMLGPPSHQEAQVAAAVPAPKRYSLREKPRSSQIFPLFHTLTLAAQQASSALRPLSVNGKQGGKSARTRLFASPTADGQENKPSNTMKQVETRKMQPKLPKLEKLPVLKQPRPLGRRSLDSTTPESAQPRTRMISRSNRKARDCLVVGCTKNARSKGLCKRHGGGKRCSVDGCSRSDQGGGRCISHGGGRRCAVEECKNSAQSRGLCKSHGGGKRCTVPNCMKSCQSGGLCREHGGVVPSKVPVCLNSRHNSGACQSDSSTNTVLV